MNLSIISGSPAVNPACPNRNPKFPFRHSKTAGVNLLNRPQWAAEELCTPTGALRPTNLGRDAFHPRPTSFRRGQINKARTFLRAEKVLFSYIAHPPIAHFCPSSVLWIPLRPYVFFVPFVVSLIDFLVSSSHFTPDFLRFFEIFDFHFEPKNQFKTASPTLN
jgi:hypothetical protein